MIREHKGPAGPRPANQSPTRRSRDSLNLSQPPPSRRILSNAPMLRTAPANSHTLFSLGANDPSLSNDLGDATTSFDFLPSVSFDDLQSSLESASTDFKLAQFPSPTGQGSILQHRRPDDISMPEPSNVTRSGSTTRVVIPPSSASAAPPAASGGGSGGVSNSNTATKPPRKSIGPGVTDAEYGARATAHRRRPSLASNSDRTLTTDLPRTSIDTGASYAGVSSQLTAATRASKARSFQPPTRPSYTQPNATPLTDTAARAASISARSPRVPPKGTPNATTKRVSVMPGMPSPSHLTGLGARTISPTDTRRLKRMSMHHTAVSSANGSVPRTPADTRPSSRSPSVYESPKEPTMPMDLGLIEKKKSSLAHDSSSIHSNSTGTVSITLPIETTGKMQRKGSLRKSSLQPPNGDGSTKPHAVASSRKNLPPLRLPPMIVGPIATPTAAKIAALQRKQEQTAGNLSPPPSRMLPKTPTTPMTASKTSFFSRHRADKTELQLRSSSSIQPTRVDSSAEMNPGSSSESLSAAVSPKLMRKASISPFLSSSVPQGGGEHMYLKRSKTGADFATITESLFEAKSASKSSRPLQQNPALSLPCCRRGTSKGNLALPPGLVDKPPEYNTRQESMPPPRLPASATMANFGSLSKPASPTPSTKTSVPTTYLETRRRKSSASSLNTYVSVDRQKADTWGNTTQPISVKIPINDMSTERLSLSRNSSVMQKILKAKPSTIQMKQSGMWTADLDKDDITAEEEMRKLGSRRKETEIAARTLDALRKRATPKEHVDPHEAIRIAMLNVYERGEIIDYPDVYFCGTQNARKVIGDLHSQKPNFGYDDERGDYSIVPGDHLAYRYEIIDVLGKGSFGQVVRCIDHCKGALVAIKIIRNKKRFHQQALVEVNILKKLREWDPDNKYSLVQFTDHFYFRGHLCLSTELLDMNLYEFIKANAFRGFSLKLIRRFTKQLLSSLNLLKQHRVIHCDLKPENILLRHPMHTEIKVIDFGSSCFESEKVYTYIQSRFYRSPEVILGMTYGLPIDMWSLGCILAELYTGVPIFPGENEGQATPSLVKTLQQVLKCDDEAFLDFIARCLRWDPDRRMKPEEAIRHEFITGHKVSIPRIPTRDYSPAKRGSNHLPGSGRPLPEPPTNFRHSGSTRVRDSNGVSPHKAFASVSRRTSAATNTSNVGIPTKRTSTGAGPMSAGASGLPRAAGRSVSSKQDLASAGASAAMNRRQ
ncbi:unnamed protein product [Parascedosporium putredinis]|uniref:dual-specificity kinase n=1 Tax=Parascedosporium putredinis TaxID=1442378 RepID=A0A9P1H394_9PEZI|nr:unnamed protein product [Parascedosporium putredinis]CAI7995646.1 unnamed protein product [Parascedosporium putredinis]